MIFAMNLFEKKQQNIRFIQPLGVTDAQIEQFFRIYRALGSSTYYIWKQIREFCDGNINRMLVFVEVMPFLVSESRYTVTGKYTAKVKIAFSVVDLIGEESITRLLNITDADNPYPFDFRRGRLTRVAGGGIHFADEIFKNKKELNQVYLGVIQNCTIEIEGFKRQLDTLIIATSYNCEIAYFLLEKEQASIVAPCRLCYMDNNTNYKLQFELAS